MDFLIARQPIFDVNGDVVAYELLFRNKLENVFPEFDGDKATANVMMDNFILNNVTKLTDGKKAFVNFTEKLLLNDYAYYLHKQDVVIEILEDIPAHDAAVAACQKLREAGYTVALDDFVLEPGANNAELVNHCDIVKIDFVESRLADRRRVYDRLAGSNVVLLAEKIETVADYKLALAEGFTYFQGYYFAKPEIISGQRLPESKLSKMRLMQAMNLQDFAVDKIVSAIKQDVSLSFKLLRLINSAAFGLTKKITSIQRAVVHLGLLEMRKWVSFVAMADVCDEKSPELVRSALMRARLGEQLASTMGMARQKDDVFLVGLFSLADAMMGREMADLINEIALADEVKSSLLGETGAYTPILDFVKAVEKGDWCSVDVSCSDLNITQQQLLESYNQSQTWVNEAMAAARVSRR